MLTALCFAALRAQAATYYVAQYGGGSDCSQSSPCGTIADGIARMSGGDTLIIGDGTYDEMLGVPGRGGHIPSGTSGARTTIRSENKWGAIIKPNSSIISGGWGVINIIAGHDWIELDGLFVDAEFSGASAIYLPENGSSNATDVLIQNCKILGGLQPFSNNGISWRAAGVPPIGGSAYTGHIVRNCDISRTTGYAIYATGGTHWVIENNYLHDWIRPGPNDVGDIHTVYGIASRGSHNTIRGNRIVRMYDGPGSTTVGCMVLSNEFSFGSDGNQIYNNICADNPTNGIVINYSVTNTLIAFNTFHNSPAGYGVLLYDTTSGNIVRNNLCSQLAFGCVRDDAADTMEDHNLETGDAQFVSAENGNFDLQSGSVARGAGVAISGITTDFDDMTRANPPDVGAHEFGGELSTNNCVRATLCDGSRVEGTLGQEICSDSNLKYVCTESGWQSLGVSCTCEISVDVPSLVVTPSFLTQGEAVRITGTNVPTSNCEWVGLYDSGTSNLVDWVHLSGNRTCTNIGDASFTWTMTRAGTFVLKYHGGSEGYPVLAVAGPIRVAAGAPYSCVGGGTCDGQRVDGTPSQVVCGGQEIEYVCTPSGWQTTGNTCTCEISVDVPSLVVTPSFLTQGEAVRITGTNVPTSNCEWVGLYDSGTSNLVDWVHLSGTRTCTNIGDASFTWTMTRAGTFVLKYHGGSEVNGEYPILAVTSAITVTAPPPPANSCDLNNDSAVNAVDMQGLVNPILTNTAGSKEDLDDSGTANAVDVQLMANVILGLRTCP